MNDLDTTQEYLYRDHRPGWDYTYLWPSLAKLFPRDRKIKILDLGCGNGYLTNMVARLGHEVVGVDSSGSGIRFARDGFAKLDFIRADIYDLPYELLENSFDIVLSVEVIEHLLYPRKLIVAAKRCLKQGGSFILTTPYHGYLKNLAIAVSGRTDSHFNALWDNGHIKFFSKKTLSGILKEDGFTDIRFTFAGNLPWLWKSMVCHSSILK
jgi:2-polyprenyl-3-methyl-5-hydroxy-6-metoxy-1,4-benzoquinol methylase